VRPIDPVKPRLDPIGANAWGAPLVDDFHLEGSRHRLTFGRNCRPSPQGWAHVGSGCPGYRSLSARRRTAGSGFFQCHRAPRPL